ncbi:MAG: hypothetical protein IT381_27580 [Deltaproteobacteria bacterium]|nr:hypothetical protein [Deltaproteobacteria bacterium]
MTDQKPTKPPQAPAKPASTAPAKSPAAPPAKAAAPGAKPAAAKSPEEAELEAKIARQILAKNPKLRDAGFDTAWIVERQSTARKGAKALPPGALDTTDLDSLRDAYDERMAGLEAQIEQLKQTIHDTKRGAREAIAQWVSTHEKPNDKTQVKQALDLRRAFLDAVGYKG